MGKHRKTLHCSEVNTKAQWQKADLSQNEYKEKVGSRGKPSVFDGNFSIH